MFTQLNIFYNLFAYYLFEMSNKRELSALSSDLGGYWGEESSAAKKAPKKSNASGKKTTNHNPKPSEQTYVIKEKTHAEADFYGGDTVRVFLPKTELGDVIDKHLYWKFANAEEFNRVDYGGREDEIKHILETGGESSIAPFREPLNASFMESLSFFNGGEGSFGTRMKPGLKNSKGSAIDQMKAFTKWYVLNQHAHGYLLELMQDFKWLIETLEAKKSK